MHKVFILLFIFIVVSGNDENEGILEKLSSLNEEWLKATSIPEVAVLLKHPPYSYHIKLLSNYETAPGYFVKSNIDTLFSPPKNLNAICRNDLVRIVSNINSSWALQMLDSDGKLSSGLQRGGLLWPGHFGECISTYAPADDDDNGDFHGQYCVTSWNLNVSKKYSNVPLMIGVCVPDSCSETYITELGNNALYILDRFPMLKKYSSHVKLSSVSCKLKDKPVDTATIIYLVFVSLFASLSIVGTFFTLYKNKKESAQRYQTSTETFASVNTKSEDNGSKETIIRTRSISTSLVHDDKAALTSNAERGDPRVEVQEMKSDSIFEKFCKCFSSIENGKKILNTESSGDQLLSIHGIRFLSLTWVILGHTYISSISIIGNRVDVLKEMDSFGFQMLLQAPFSVDSFFLLSGFLLAYLFLKDIDKRNGKTSWAYFYLHRIWRLTPVYMVVVFFYMLVYKHLGSGPFWNDHNCDEARGSWWKFLLYINNFIPIHQMCVGWSWYLANDMQFYIISPLFLYPLWRWPVAGFCLIFSFLCCTWITTGVLSYHYELIPMFVGVTKATDFAAYSKKMWDSFDMVYDKPYCRIAPYLIGIALGYILYRINHRKHFLTWWQQILGWTIAAFCGLSVVFGLFHVTMSRTTALFYNSLSRSSFSLSLAWLIFVCETGHGGFLNKLLSWKMWIPLSRLTYCSYLIHPIFIHAYYSSYQTEFFFTEFIAVTSFLGFLLMSYAAAFLFSVVFESPLMNLEKLLVKTKTK